jgi:hypothetical protein
MFDGARMVNQICERGFVELRGVRLANVCEEKR